MYPSGALLLTDWGLTHDRWFRSGQEHKRRNLELLADEFPNMRWLLFGDNGQHDESIYSHFAQQHGDRVAAIGIRQLSASEAVLAGGHSETGDHTGSEVPWIYSPDGAGMAKSLQGLGILWRVPPRPGLPPPLACRLGVGGVGRDRPGVGRGRHGAGARSQRDGVPVAGREDFLEPVERGLPGALLGFPVHVQQPELLLVAGRPLEVVHERPHVVAAQLDRLCRASG